MKSLFALCLMLSFFTCSDSAPAALTSPEIAAPETITAKVEEAPAAPFSTGTEVCQLYSISKASTLLGCNSDLNKKISTRDRSYACTFICTDPFVTFSVSAGWTKDGKKQDVSRRDNSAALEKVNIPGADAAHFVEAQGRLMVTKGKYQVTVQIAPAERDVIFEVAKTVIAEL